jgi:hypothetical protein
MSWNGRDLCLDFLDDLEAAGVSETDAAEAMVAVGLLAKFRADLPDNQKGRFDRTRGRYLVVCESVVPSIFGVFRPTRADAADVPAPGRHFTCLPSESGA